jgi:hypothetical protein
MNLNLLLDSARVRAGLPRWRPLGKRALPLAALSALVAILSYGIDSRALAQDRATADRAHGPECSLRTLRGAYGLVGSGVRGLGPAVSESFTTVSMVTYDGRGSFDAIGTSHGAITGVREGAAVTGTYYVDPDCTGGQTTYIPGLPPLEDRFVIVENGREVRTVVISPATTIATANLRKR